jgi:hypothetical protein
MKHILGSHLNEQNLIILAKKYKNLHNLGEELNILEKTLLNENL